MGAALSTRRNIPCPKSVGMCVAVPRGLIVVSDNACKLYVYSLIHGTLTCSIGSKGSGKGQLNFHCGGLCVSPDGDSVLVADTYNDRVQEVRIMDGSWVRFAGVGVLRGPQYVDCNADVIVVSESSNDRISVLSWADGSLRARFGSYGSGPGRLRYPRGIRLLADGSGAVVVDFWNDRLCVFTVSGEFVTAVGSIAQGLHYPRDVLERVSDASFIVANSGCSLVRLSRDGVSVDVHGKHESGDGELYDVTALTALPNDGYVVINANHWRVQQLADLRARLAWMRACASCVV